MKHPLILAADDDADDRQEIREMLVSGYDTPALLMFGSGLELMHHLSSTPSRDPLPHLVVLDMHMPIWDGIRTLKTIKAEPRFTAIPVVMLSASVDEKDRILSLKLGAEAFFSKPLSYKGWIDIGRELRRIINGRILIVGSGR